jgi:hypothetical protein
MIERLHLKNVGPAPEMDLTFASRLNVITGDNGLGKSFLLDVAWWALTRTWAGPKARPANAAKGPRISYVVSGEDGKEDVVTSEFVFRERAWRLPEKRPAAPGIVVYARVDGGFSVWDPARNDAHGARAKQAGDDALGASRRTGAAAAMPAAYHFDGRSLWHGLSIADKQVCEGLIRDWVGWQRARAPEFERLERVLRILSVPEEPLTAGAPVRVEIGEGYDTPTIQPPYEDAVPVTHASAGAQRVAALAYVLVWAWHEHVLASGLLQQEPERRIVLLVDEPETHLHPKWQRVILPAILEAGEALREDEQHNRHVEVRGGAWAQQGDALNWLVSEVFGLRQARSREAERAIDAAEAYMRGERAGLPAGLGTQKAIHEELLRLLPGHDPFWPRWVVSMEQPAKRKRAR